MRFRDHQDAARTSSRQLLWAFALAVLLLVLAVNGLLALAWRLIIPAGDWPRWFFETNTALVLLYVLGGWWLESVHLRKGGSHVAEMAGGREITQPSGLLEQRLRNVVEELAIVTQLPPPRIFVLDREDAINAFAAGWSPDDAVVAVTRGTLERLDRDELQGVIAHEFSHIQHGDIRLNMRMMGMVWGIEMLYHWGATLTQPIDTHRGRGIWAVFGYAFMAAGWIGVLAGRVLKAAVSRQREYLADASAVKYTRLTTGIGGALRKAYDQQRRHADQLRTAQAQAFTHMLLVSSIGGAWLATHPSIPQRLSRLYGRTLGALPAEVQPAPDAAQEQALGAASAQRLGFAPGTPVPVRGKARRVRPQEQAPEPADDEPAAHRYDVVQRAARAWDKDREQLALERLHRAHGPGQRRAALLACLLPDDHGPEAQAWHEALADVPSAPGVRDDVLALSPRTRLPTFERLLQACQGATLDERRALLDGARRIVRADGHVAPLERAMYLLMAQQLRQAPDATEPALNAGMHMDMAKLSEPIAVLSAWIARSCLAPSSQALWTRDVWQRLELPGTPPAAPARDGDAISRALQAVTALSWMQRPRLVRTWVEAVLEAGIRDPEALGMLRCLCRLVDIPLPPGLALAYTEQP